MELIATTRVARAQVRAREARPYAEKITSVIEDLAASGAAASHPLLAIREVKRVAFVIITSDRGLAGAYNSGVIRAAERELMARRLEGQDYSLILIGKKARDYFSFRHYKIDGELTVVPIGYPPGPEAQAVVTERHGAYLSDRYGQLYEAGSRRLASDPPQSLTWKLAAGSYDFFGARTRCGP